MKGDNKNIFFRWLLYLSSFTPLFILIFLNNMKEFSLKEATDVYNTNKIFWNVFATIIFLSLFSLIVWLCKMKKEASGYGAKYELKNIINIDNEVMSYFVTYLIPILSLDISNLSSIIMNSLLLLTFGIYFVNNNTLHFNVLLLIFGYHIYTDDNSNIIISRKQYFEIINENLKADQIGTSNIFYI